MALSWFGYCNSDGTNKASYSIYGPIEWWGFKNYVTGFTCPGDVGTEWLVKELSFYIASRVLATNIRLAVYDTSRNLICQGSAQKAVADVSNTWQGHNAGDGSDITWNGANTHLNGGQDYLLFVSWDTNSGFYFYYDPGSVGDSSWSGTDYTGGFPDPIAAGTNCGTSYSRPAIRCGVEVSAGGGLSIPVAMATNRMRRN